MKYNYGTWNRLSQVILYWDIFKPVPSTKGNYSEERGIIPNRLSYTVNDALLPTAAAWVLSNYSLFD